MKLFWSAEEAEWAIEVMKEMGIPVGLTMALGPTGDTHGISPGECAVRMARAGGYYTRRRSTDLYLYTF